MSPSVCTYLNVRDPSDGYVGLATRCDAHFTQHMLNLRKCCCHKEVNLEYSQTNRERQPSIRSSPLCNLHVANELKTKLATININLFYQEPLKICVCDNFCFIVSNARMVSIENQLGMHAVRLAEQDLRFQVLETANFEGVLVWKIKNFARRKLDADSGKTLSLYSQPFYTSRYGYKMCARIYLNGDGMGKGTHVSLFFVVMRGDYDALLPWPFRQKVTFKDKILC